MFEIRLFTILKKISARLKFDGITTSQKGWDRVMSPQCSSELSRDNKPDSPSPLYFKDATVSMFFQMT